MILWEREEALAFFLWNCTFFDNKLSSCQHLSINYFLVALILKLVGSDYSAFSAYNGLSILMLKNNDLQILLVPSLPLCSHLIMVNAVKVAFFREVLLEWKTHCKTDHVNSFHSLSLVFFYQLFCWFFFMGY